MASHRVELVVTRQYLDKPAAAVAEDDEILDQAQEATLVENALEQCFQLGGAFGGDVVARYRAPGHEPFAVGGQRADPRGQPVRNHQSRIRVKEGRNLRLVGLKLIERTIKGGIFIAGVLELDHAQRQAVDKDDNIRPPVGLVFDDGELINRQPIVRGQVFKVDQPRGVTANGAISPRDFDGNTLNQEMVQAAVFFGQGGGFRLRELAEHFFRVSPRSGAD